ncbi:hypothetical protein DSO57_1026301 [Entomophthora muscae]|uniref:Uncharacterized protein n=1 Tax=Entomophthora muscae TaxID=34485 RepID=A0ACC2T2E4_9FUNG|nr:hypothetical protein DSO57_1026301 [Entomophthora muscae]
MILIGGSCESSQVGRGAFQELDQVAACRPYSKYSGRPLTFEAIPSVLDQAYRNSVSGRPGPTYVDFPADLIRGIASNNSSPLSSFKKPNSQAAHDSIKRAAEILLSAKRPLIIVGKGAGLAHAEDELAELVALTGAPFLPSPMAKGMISDLHPLCAGASRSQALQHADVVLVLGARLNWMFQFGRRFNVNAKLLVADIEPEEINQNRAAEVALVGDLKSTLKQLIQMLSLRKKEIINPTPFVNMLTDASKRNAERTRLQIQQSGSPMNHYMAISTIQDRLNASLPSGDYVLVSEGARTMDVTRVLVPSQLPRRRLDAGTLGAMGVGMGYAIAAQLAYPSKRVVAIFGDSAFGFSAMDVETAIRYKLPLIIIVINNGGIYHGLDDLSTLDPSKYPSFALSPNTNYELLSKIAPGSTSGYSVRSPAELNTALEKALRHEASLSIINVHIDHRPASQGLYWMDSSSTSGKL